MNTAFRGAILTTVISGSSYWSCLDSTGTVLFSCHAGSYFRVWNASRGCTPRVQMKCLLTEWSTLGRRLVNYQITTERLPKDVPSEEKMQKHKRQRSHCAYLCRFWKRFISLFWGPFDFHPFLSVRRNPFSRWSPWRKVPVSDPFRSPRRSGF